LAAKLNLQQPATSVTWVAVFSIYIYIVRRKFIFRVVKGT
jgi:hypothetical protein